MRLQNVDISVVTGSTDGIGKAIAFQVGTAMRVSHFARKFPQRKPSLSNNKQMSRQEMK